MTRKVTVTVKELQALREIVTGAASLSAVRLKSLLEKAERAHSPLANEPADPLPDLNLLEHAFLAKAGAKGAKMQITYEQTHAVRGLARKVQATPERVAMVGAWLARQRWFTGTATLWTALGKWVEWYSRAVAEGGRRAVAGGPARLPSRVNWDDWDEQNRGGPPDASDEDAPGPAGPAQGD